ncbi:MAG TPA: hypothetical protein VFR34_15975 [Paracoccaceae bacterium]|nr:hypothetical protein [Paracoccaceae bacterium]
MQRSDDPRSIDAELDALFAEARAAHPPLSEAFLARVLADAAQVTAERATARVLPFRPRRRFARLLEPLGGWQAAAALAACALAGFWVGFSGPDSVAILPAFEQIASDDALLAYQMIEAEDALALDSLPES